MYTHQSSLVPSCSVIFSPCACILNLPSSSLIPNCTLRTFLECFARGGRCLRLLLLCQGCDDSSSEHFADLGKGIS
ncbi:hypothetical protein Lalb_Chr03g0038721 [Lupinus albus]|uniref:Uncharacterized protein n=1 Tax=Lupinus albus TaxID=3870 RepID=A0A6A4QXT0_LUPAL|nr:hypothetical protein Lalb_Chr03g0038721 [Lupinus albus]